METYLSSLIVFEMMSELRMFMQIYIFMNITKETDFMQKFICTRIL